jgi:hypothetical protein
MTFIDETTIKADNGMMLTNGTAFGVIVYLGNNDSIDNWHEITKEETERLQSEEVPTEDFSELEQKAHAYDILTGVIE